MVEGREYWDASVAMGTAAEAHHAASALPYDNNPLDLTLFIYAYNNESTLIETVATVVDAMRVVERSYEILVVDDASRDGTAGQARRAIEEHSGVAIMARANRRRKGAARCYLDAALLGRGRHFRMVRAGGGESMETLVDILRAMDEADIVVPYYIEGPRRGPDRLAALGAGLLSLATGQRLNDFHASALHLRENILRWPPATRGAGFQAELLCRLLMQGFTCKQLPCRSARQDVAIGWKEMLAALDTAVSISLRRIFG